MPKETQSLIKLRDVPFFSRLSVKDLNHISKYLMEKLYTKGQFFHFSGDECQNITIVRSGRIKVFRTSPSGREQIIARKISEFYDRLKKMKERKTYSYKFDTINKISSIPV